MVWDLAPLDICPIHHISLIANCPICGDRLLRTGADIFRCPTGHDLTCAAVPPDPRMHLRADAIRVIYGACDHVYTRAGPKASAPFMDGRDPSLLLENLLLLGRIGAALTVPQLRVSERHPTSETLQKGYDLALAWPKNLLALLAASRPDGEQPFAPMFFQWLRRELAYASRRGYGTEIADAIRQYTGERGFNFRSGILSGTVPDERQFISVSAAARCMKVRAGTCIKIARRERWSGWQGLRSGHMCTVRRSDVDAWCAANQTRIIPRVAGKRLGTTAKVIRELVYLGAFGALAQGRTGSGFKQIYLTEEEIASAQERIQEAINYDSNADSITWAGYCRIRRERELKFSHLIASVLSGLAKPTSMSGNTLRSLRFLRQDLFNLSIQ
jgi:hypothetical protein